jgi:hypothetical protein
MTAAHSHIGNYGGQHSGAIRPCPAGALKGVSGYDPRG